jgi:hypothetical protein
MISPWLKRFCRNECKPAAVIKDKRPEALFLHRVQHTVFKSKRVLRFRADDPELQISFGRRIRGTAGTGGHPPIRRANKSNRTVFASLQIVKPRAIIPKNLSTRPVTHVFNLEKLVQSVGKVRVDVGVVR